jgi:hypothetical protein
LLSTALQQIHAEAAQFAWHDHQQVAGLLEFFKVFEEKAVLSVIERCPLAATLQDLIG